MTTEKDIKWAKKWINEYEAKAIEFRKKSKICKANQRGAYIAHAIQSEKSAKRWQKNLLHLLAAIKRET